MPARSLNRRTLYLLALFQLVAGPAVLMGVLVLGKLTVKEAPKHGVAEAFAKAWQSHEFQALLQSNDVPAHPDSKIPLPKPEPTKAKLHVISWSTAPALIPTRTNSSASYAWLDAWTPTWPQAPPGPPPRVA